MKRLAAIILLTVLAAPAIPAGAQSAPPTSDGPEGINLVWKCMPNWWWEAHQKGRDLDPSGETCDWVYDMTHDAMHDHDDHDDGRDEGPPGMTDPYQGGVHEGTRIVWTCMPGLDGTGQVCAWIYDTGHGHSHGEEEHHDDHDEPHRPQALAAFSASCQTAGTDIQCQLSITPTEGDLQPIRYRVAIVDGQTKAKVAILHLSPTDLNPTVTLSDADNSNLILKARAVGDCKRETKRDAGAETCSRFKGPVSKATVRVG